MLILSRRPGESIELRLTAESLQQLAEQAGLAGVVIRVMVTDVRGDKSRLGIDAPRECSVHRSEVQRSIERDALLAAS
jgi:carbon storage regulator